MLLFNSITNKSFRSISILAVGTGLSQLIMVLVIPILTRLYTPDEFEFFAFFSALMTILTTVGCLRFELAIPIAKSLNARKSLLVLSVTSSLFVSTFALCAIFLVEVYLPDIHSNYLSSTLFYILPLGVFFGCLYASMQFWHNSEKRFKLIAIGRVSQSASGALLQLVFGYFALGKLGLILGYALNSVIGVLLFIKEFYKSDAPRLTPVKALQLKRVYTKYKDYPTYSTIEALFNSLGTQLPIIIIATYSIGPEAGFLALATRVMLAPLSLVGSSVSQVFISTAGQKYRDNKLDQYVTNIISKLTIIGLPLLVFVGFFSVEIFSMTFGCEWARSGEIVMYMIPWLIMQFIVSPISISLNVVDKVRVSSILNSCGFGLRVIGVIFVALYYPTYVVEAYCFFSFIFYLVFFIATLNLINIRKKYLGKIITIFITCLLCSLLFSYFLGLMLSPLAVCSGAIYS
ncbi:oligosaccharide flippase family protein [Vibrio tapetis subsp. quintayensis]|uniref:lipopolysaccharide biosynthesis protein n=1 Tax=Vibrio tapetis TaxID=52443 RepID=UPI0025B2B3F4|nr:oligosaccharide flippase family protein [Vibrio tapetis]MDN3679478.1 oligosaccharide flippase family protein [Vibrio tapetis subsp. quintayensis]